MTSESDEWQEKSSGFLSRHSSLLHSSLSSLRRQAQGLDRVEPRRPPGRVKPNSTPTADRHRQRQEDRRHVQLGRQVSSPTPARQRTARRTPIASPTTTPSRPPIVVCTTASIRNCRVMSRRLAPRARRMPISRVRSVTVASMMFMMPMPPTSSEIDGDQHQQHREAVLGPLGLLQPVQRHRHRPVLLRGALLEHARLISVAGRPAPCRCRDDGQRDLAAARPARRMRDPDWRMKIVSPKRTRQVLQRDVDVVVEVLGRLAAAACRRSASAPRATPTTCRSRLPEHDRLAERVLEREQLVGDVRAEHARRCRIVQRRPRRSGTGRAAMLELVDVGVLRRGADDPAVVHAGPGGGSPAGRSRIGTHADDGRRCVCEPLVVVVGQAVDGDERCGRRCAESSGGLTLRTMMLVAPCRLMSSRASCMLPSPNAISAMTGAGADDDAEHRQERPQLVQPQAAHGQDEAAADLVPVDERERAESRSDARSTSRSRPAIAGSTTRRARSTRSRVVSAASPGVRRDGRRAASLRSSDSIWPSRMRTTRLAQAAMSFSCVTMMIVLPAPLSRGQHLHDLVAGLRVEVAGRLVGQDHVRVVDQGCGRWPRAAAGRRRAASAGGRAGRPGRPARPARCTGPASPRRAGMPW